MTSTAVAPFFRVSRWPQVGTDAATYRCRQCDYVRVFVKGAGSRDVRMMTLAKHLADAHHTGPLAVAHMDDVE